MVSNRRMESDSLVHARIKKHLLAHRSRSFGRSDSSILALENALKSGIKFIEIDTRHTYDDEIIVFHDPFLGEITTGNGLIKDKTLEEIKTEKLIGDGVAIATLDELLELYDKADTETILCIDLKDPGLINKYCELITKYSLEDKVIFVSWVPENLSALHKVLPNTPLIFSHIPIKKWHISIVNFFSYFSKKLYKIAIKLDLIGSFRLKRLAVAVSFINEYDENANEGKRGENGWNIGHFLTGLPDGNFQKALIESGGGVCVPYWAINRAYINEAHSIGLQVWVFTLNEKNKIINYMLKMEPDVIFTDRAKWVLGL